MFGLILQCDERLLVLDIRNEIHIKSTFRRLNIRPTQVHLLPEPQIYRWEPSLVTHSKQKRRIRDIKKPYWNGL